VRGTAELGGCRQVPAEQQPSSPPAGRSRSPTLNKWQDLSRRSSTLTDSLLLPWLPFAASTQHRRFATVHCPDRTIPPLDFRHPPAVGVRLNVAVVAPPGVLLDFSNSLHFDPEFARSSGILSADTCFGLSTSNPRLLDTPEGPRLLRHQIRRFATQLRVLLVVRERRVI
jgi:hypothetical protein